jgi:hypothetical protein
MAPGELLRNLMPGPAAALPTIIEKRLFEVGIMR